MVEKAECIKCKLFIDKTKDSFIEFNEFCDGKFYKTIFWHRDCWRDFLDIKRHQKQLMNMSEGLFNSLIEQGLIKQNKEMEIVN